MFKIITTVNRGILFITLQGTLNNENFYEFSDEINYLLYNQGMNYFALNFDDLEIVDKNLLYKIQNKLIEICLSSGKVVLCGLNKEAVKKIDCGNDNLKFVGSELEVFNYLNI